MNNLTYDPLSIIIKEFSWSEIKNLAKVSMHINTQIQHLLKGQFEHPVREYLFFDKIDYQHCKRVISAGAREVTAIRSIKSFKGDENLDITLKINKCNDSVLLGIERDEGINRRDEYLNIWLSTRSWEKPNSYEIIHHKLGYDVAKIVMRSKGTPSSAGIRIVNNCMLVTVKDKVIDFKSNTRGFYFLITVEDAEVEITSDTNLYAYSQK